jgi:hypothetical protein
VVWGERVAWADDVVWRGRLVPDTDFVLLLPAFLPIGATHLLRLVPGTDFVFC